MNPAPAESAAALRAHYDAVRARLNGRPTVVIRRPPPAPPKRKRPPIIYPVRLRDYGKPIGPQKPKNRTPTLNVIMDVVCAAFVVDPMHITGPRRFKEYVLARHVIYYLAREMTPMSFPQIGMRLGNKDHTTIMHGAQRMARRIAADVELATRVKWIAEKVRVRS